MGIGKLDRMKMARWRGTKEGKGKAWHGCTGATSQKSRNSDTTTVCLMACMAVKMVCVLAGGMT